MSKYERGDKITSLDELYSQEFVYWHHKITHKGWFLQWKLYMTAQAIKQGAIYKAVRKENENE